MTTTTTTGVADVVARLRDTFATGRTRDVQWRRTQLQRLEQMMTENEAQIATALAADLDRKPFEAWLADSAGTAAEARYAAKHVKKWMRRKYRLLELAQLPGRG
jgi:aldehyde dehydrogenase (NAD+)